MKKFLLILFLFFNYSSAKVPNVVATIKPLHSLVSQVMGDLGEVNLLITSGSPHGYNLKPSDVKILSNADLLVWVSDDLEVFMPDVAKKTFPDKILVWQKLSGIKHIKSDEDDDEDEHHHGDFNPHLWLSIKNSEILLKNIAQELIDLDPENQPTYRDNLAKALVNLEKLELSLNKKLANTKLKPFIVFHDAYPYFIEEFNLNLQGIVKADAEHEISPKKIENLEKDIFEKNISCIFQEPQFNSNLVDKIANNTNIKIGVLDPIGADLNAGKGLYSQLLNNLANNLNSCLIDNEE